MSQVSQPSCRAFSAAIPQGAARTALSRLLEVATEEGMDPVRDLPDRHIGPALLCVKGQRIDRIRNSELTRYVIKTLGVPDIGFRVGRRFNLGDLGILGHAMISSPSIAALVETYMRYRDAFGSVFAVSRRCSASELIISAAMSPCDAVLHRHFLENWLLTWTCLPELSVESRGLFTSVHVAFPEPVYGDCYRELFQCPVYFSQPATEVRLDREVAALPLKFSNSGIHEWCRSECAFAQRECSQADRLEILIREKLHAASEVFPSADEIARELNMSARTLRRRIADLGTSYNAILFDVRMERARRYQAESRLSIKQIAALLGYRDSPSYHRAFKRHFGLTPGEYRAARFRQ